MKKLLFFAMLSFALCANGEGNRKPWDNGKLTVSNNKRFLQHENGAPFFWLGDRKSVV